MSEALAVIVTDPETVALFAGAVRETAGGVVSGWAFVVIEILEESAEALPALSYEETAYVYAVEETRLVFVNEFVAEVPT